MWSNFETHLNRHLQITPFTCGVEGCNELSADRAAISRHCVRHHGHVPKRRTRQTKTAEDADVAGEIKTQMIMYREKKERPTKKVKTTEDAGVDQPFVVYTRPSAHKSTLYKRYIPQPGSAPKAKKTRRYAPYDKDGKPRSAKQSRATASYTAQSTTVDELAMPSLSQARSADVCILNAQAAEPVPGPLTSPSTLQPLGLVPQPLSDDLEAIFTSVVASLNTTASYPSAFVQQENILHDLGFSMGDVQSSDSLLSDASSDSSTQTLTASSTIDIGESCTTSSANWSLASSHPSPASSQSSVCSAEAAYSTTPPPPPSYQTSSCPFKPTLDYIDTSIFDLSHIDFSLLPPLDTLLLTEILFDEEFWRKLALSC